MISILTGVITAVLAWFAINWVGKPILDTREARIKALQSAQQNAYVGFEAPDERKLEARAALGDAAATLQSISRGQSWLIRLYCRLFRYDLETAAGALITLHNMIGGPPSYDRERRKLLLDGIHVLLRACGHLRPERIREIEAQLEHDKRAAEASS
jgi:hypothetical protein